MSSGPNIGGFLFRRFLGSAVSNAAGYALGGAIQPALEPLTRLAANTAWALQRVYPLPAAVAAEAWLRGFWGQQRADDEAAKTGVGADELDVLYRLASQPPTFEQLVALRRRGAITPEVYSDGLAQLGYAPEWRPRLAALRNVLPSVTDLVHMAVREVFNPQLRSSLDLDAEFPGAFAERAAALGISPDLAADYWADHWQLPSETQMAQMLFRNELSPSAFSDGLKALDYAPTWRGKLETILRPIPPLSDMIRFAVRDVYTPATVQAFGLGDDFPDVFAQQAALHGMSREHAENYWRAHWRLPSAIQGFRMLWRDIINPGQLDILLKALDYPPFWRDRLRDLAFIVPGRIDLKRMLRHGILNESQVLAGYQRLGYAPADAQRMTEIALAELASGDVTQKWAERAAGRLYTVAHNEYLDESLDEAGARSVLALLGAGAPEQGRVLAFWNREDEIARQELSAAQVKKAWKADRFDEAEAVRRLGLKGMSPDDAGHFLNS